MEPSAASAADTVAERQSGPRPTPLGAPAPRDEPELFGRGSILWDTVGDVLYLPLTQSAFLLQVMHPVISAGVDRHSVFRTDPVGRAVRSFDSVMLWIYGGQEAIDEGKRLRKLHKPIRGTDEQGERYSALDPEAYAWVHATAFVAGVKAFPLTQGREMTFAEQEELYDEILRLGAILRVPVQEMPTTVPDYWDYYRTMVNDRLERTKVAAELVETTKSPVLPQLSDTATRIAQPGTRALGRILYLMTIGTMTPDARAVLGLGWTRRQQGQLRMLMGGLRGIRGRLPERFAFLPLAYHARRHADEIEAIRGRATKKVT